MGSNSRFFTKILALSVVVLLSIMVWGQAETGQITGTVTDSTGAVVSGAQITVTSVERQTTRSTVSTANGVFAVPSLQPGAYKVTVAHAGFATYAKVVTITVGSTVGVDAQLKVGAAGQTIEVVAAGAGVQVNTETQTLEQVITAQQMSELPSLYRDPYALVGTAGYVASDVSGRGTGYSVNGQRSASTDIMLDGAENMNMFSAQTGMSVPMDSVQEFSLLTSDFTAEFGRASGGVVNVATKSGTNTFHGSAYEYLRNSALSSNSFQNAATEWDALHQGTCTMADEKACPGYKGQFARNQFGYSIGGPVKKNKLFFFNNTEWIRVRSSGSRQRWVLTPDFISALPANVQSFMNKGTLKSGLQNTGTLTASQLATFLNASTGPFATWAAAHPSTPVFQGVNWTVASNLGGGSPGNYLMQVDRVDYNFSDKTQLYGRFALESDDWFPGGSTASPYDGYDIGEKQYNQNWLVSLTHTFSPTVVSQSKLVFNRYNDNQPLTGNPAGPTLYMNGSSVPTLSGKKLDFPGYLPEGPGTAVPFGGPQNVYQINEDLSWTHGKHTFRFGTGLVHMRDNRTFGAYMNAVEDLSSGSSKTAFDNLMNGVLNDYAAAINPQGKYPCPRTIDPATGTVIKTVSDACKVTLPVGFPNFTRNNRYNDMAFYGQDSFKVNRRLTVNVGLRWEYYGVQHNADPKLDSNFYLGSGSNIFQQIRNGKVMLAPDSPVGGLWAPFKSGFGPRVGFAYDLFGDGKTSLRGGYGISYERNFGNVTYNVIQNPPNYATITLTPTDIGGPLYITTNNAGPLSGNSGSKELPTVQLRPPKQDIQAAYAATWNLAIEREVAKNTMASISYSGSRGYHLYSITNTNRVGFGQFYMGDKFGGNCINYEVNDIIYCGNRLDPQYTNMNQRGDDGFSYYHGMNVGLRSNNLHNTGLTVTANYTWSHAIDNVSNTFAEGVNAMNLGLLDPWMPNLDKGSAEFDQRHRLTVSAIWNVPAFQHSSNKFLKNTLGGWELIPGFVAGSGQPFSLFDCSNAYTVCPRYMPVSGPVNGAGTKNPVSQYDPATGLNVNTYTYITLPLTGGAVSGIGAYGNPALGTDYYPNGYSDFPICTGLYHQGCKWPSNMTQRDAFVGPGTWNADFAVAKNFTITERVKFQFRAEMFNVFNHKNFYVDSGTFDLSGSNTVNAYKADHRDIQIGAKITF